MDSRGRVVFGGRRKIMRGGKWRFLIPVEHTYYIVLYIKRERERKSRISVVYSISCTM